MAVDERRIAVVGAGTIGGELIARLLSSGWREPGEIVATGRREERLPELAGDVHRARHLLDHHGRLDRGLGVLADRERPVVAHEHGWAPGLPQGLDDAATDRVVADERERADRHRAAELVGHHRQDARHGLAARGPCRRVRGVRVHDATDIRHIPVDVCMRGGVA